MKPDSRERESSSLPWLLAGNVAAALGNLLLLIVIVEICGAELAGKYVLALSISAPVMMFANMASRAPLAACSDAESRFRPLLRLRVVAACGCLAVCIGAIALAGYREFLPVFVTVAAGKLAESVSDLCYGLQQRRGHEKRIAASMIARAVGGVGAALLCGVGTSQLAAIALGVSAASVAVAVALDLSATRFGRVAAPAVEVAAGLGSTRWAVREGLPVGAGAAAGSLAVNVPRYFVGRFSSGAALTELAVMWYALSVGALLINALGLDLARRLGDPWRSRDRAGFAAILGAALQRAAGLGALAVAVAALIGERVIWVVVGVAGDEARVAFTVLAVGAACAYVACLYDYALLVTGKGRLQAGGIACDLAVTTVGCALLVPAHGLFGAVTAVACGGTVRVLYLALGTRRTLSIG